MSLPLTPSAGLLMPSPTTTTLAPSADGSTPSRAKVVAAAQQFEAHMVSQLLHQMRRSMREFSSDDSAMNSRTNADMLDLADDQLAASLARQGAFGIADVLIRQLLPAEATATATAAAAGGGFKPTAATVAPSQGQPAVP